MPVLGSTIPNKRIIRPSLQDGAKSKSYKRNMESHPIYQQTKISTSSVTRDFIKFKNLP